MNHEIQRTIFVAVAATAAAFASGFGLGFLLHSYYCRRKSVKYDRVGNLSSLIIYPIKSCGGISVSEATCLPLGLVCNGVGDRTFLLTDVNNHFITARQESRLVLVQPSLIENGNQDEGEGKKKKVLRLNAPGMEPIDVCVPIQTDNQEGVKCRIWGQWSRGIDCGRDVASWFERFLGRKDDSLRLLYNPWHKQERVFPHWDKWDRFRKSDTSVFADLSPYMLLGNASVRDLNDRIEINVTNAYFRPNFSIEGSLPYEEDVWQNVRIGSTCLFRCIRPCTRCIMTTINPETGVRGEEPLKQLKSYRRIPDVVVRKREGDSPVLGSFLGFECGGIVRLGDPVLAVI